MGHQWKIMENQLTIIENHWLPDCTWEGGWDRRAGRYYVWWWSMWIPLKPFGRGSLFHTFSTYLLGRTFGNHCCLSVSVSPIHLGCVFTEASTYEYYSVNSDYFLWYASKWSTLKQNGQDRIFNGTVESRLMSSAAHDCLCQAVLGMESMYFGGKNVFYVARHGLNEFWWILLVPWMHNA